MRKFVCAAVVVVLTFSVAVGDEFFASLKKIDDKGVTFTKVKKGEKGEDMTLPLTKDAKIIKGKIGKDKAFTAGDPVEKDAIKAMLEKAGEKGVFVQIVTDADNKNVTEVRVIGKKGKKKKDAN